MTRVQIAGGQPSDALLSWLAEEGYEVVAEDSRLKIWVADSSLAPASLPPGPWLVVGEEVASHQQRRDWLAVLDEESALLLPWNPSTLRPALRISVNPAGPAFLDSTALARLYTQGGRALADRVVRNFLQVSPGLLQQAQASWKSGQVDSSRRALENLKELAGGVGASSLESILGETLKEPDWEHLRTELEAARRVLDQQHRQDRTV